MHYLLSLHRCDGHLVAFLPFETSRLALDERFRHERDLSRDGVHCEEVVVIGAPDLWTLVASHGRYFAMARPTSIADCFFCATYMVQPTKQQWEDQQQTPDEDECWLYDSDSTFSELDDLIVEALRQGHCLWCHQPYRMAEAGPERSLVRHEGRCKVIGSVLTSLDTHPDHP
jgi:hypothetical protein